MVMPIATGKRIEAKATDIPDKRMVTKTTKVNKVTGITAKLSHLAMLWEPFEIKA